MAKRQKNENESGKGSKKMPPALKRCKKRRGTPEELTFKHEVPAIY